jgi:adenosine deaminase
MLSISAEQHTYHAVYTHHILSYIIFHQPDIVKATQHPNNNTSINNNGYILHWMRYPFINLLQKAMLEQKGINRTGHLY